MSGGAAGGVAAASVAADVRDGPSGRSGVRVPAGPYATRAAAKSARSRLARRGYRASLTGLSLRLGSFSSSARAERIANRLREGGYHTPVVML